MHLVGTDGAYLCRECRRRLLLKRLAPGILLGFLPILLSLMLVIWEPSLSIFERLSGPLVILPYVILVWAFCFSWFFVAHFVRDVFLSNDFMQGEAQRLRLPQIKLRYPAAAYRLRDEVCRTQDEIRLLTDREYRRLKLQ